MKDRTYALMVLVAFAGAALLAMFLAGVLDDAAPVVKVAEVRQ